MILHEEILKEVMGELLLEATRRNSIMSAMKNRWVVRIQYDDGSPDAAKGWRYLEMFCYGEGHRKEKDEEGNEHIVTNQYIRAWERSGDSKTKDGEGKRDPLKRIEGWRLFIVDKILRIEYLRHIKPFGDRPKYTSNDVKLDTVYYCVPENAGTPKSIIDTRGTDTQNEKPQGVMSGIDNKDSGIDTRVQKPTSTSGQSNATGSDNIGDNPANPEIKPRRRNIYEGSAIEAIGKLLGF
jgi:hypothetical protein